MIGTTTSTSLLYLLPALPINLIYFNCCPCSFPLMLVYCSEIFGSVPSKATNRGWACYLCYHRSAVYLHHNRHKNGDLTRGSAWICHFGGRKRVFNADCCSQINAKMYPSVPSPVLLAIFMWLTDIMTYRRAKKRHIRFWFILFS